MKRKTAEIDNLGMKPNEKRLLFSDAFHNLEELKAAIAKAETASNQLGEYIDVGVGRFELEAECLTDGSVVYNAYLNSPDSWQG
jgi:hypothetical protein